jgi:hypothetical protein
MNIFSTICRNHYYLRGFTPNPTSFFFFRARLNVVRAGKKRTKQENSSQNDRHRALLQRRNFRQSGTSLLAEISYVAALFTPLIYFIGVHELLRKFTPPAAPRFGGATTRCFVKGLCYSVVAIFFFSHESKWSG